MGSCTLSNKGFCCFSAAAGDARFFMSISGGKKPANFHSIAVHFHASFISNIVFEKTPCFTLDVMKSMKK